MTTRVDIIEALIAAKGYQRYLEIGVDHGGCLLNISAERKLAVDPCFRIPWHLRIWACLKNPANLQTQYFEQTSNDFFQREGGALGPEGLDIAFVDGLHTYAQSLADIENCLKHLRSDGVVLVHDCNPSSAAMAFPASSFEAAIAARPPGWTGEWCGDVWKAMAHLRLTRTDLTVLVLDTDYGVGVIYKRPASVRPQLGIDAGQLAQMPYEDFAQHRQEMLGLSPVTALQDVIQQLR